MPWSAILAENIWWVCAAIFVGLRLPHYRRSWREPVKDHRRTALDWVLLRCGEIGYGVLPFVYIIFKQPSFANYPFFSPFVVVGTLFFAAAIWIIYRSHRDLAGFFSDKLEIREQHRVVSAGIYRFIRHPMYAAFLLWAVAQAMLLPNWIAGFSALVAGSTLFAVRIPREEAMMLQTFGDDYLTYMASTTRFIPGFF